MLTSSALAAGSLVFAQAPAQAEGGFARELRHHPYFPFVLHERIETRPPYTFLVVQTGKGETNAVLVERYAGGLDPLLQTFERELAQPLGLKRREDERLVVAVLATPGAIEDYRNVAAGARHFEGQGLYDPALNAAVLCEDPFHKVRDLAAQERSERHAFLHVCMQAWSAPGVTAPSRSWILEALACELSRRSPEAPAKPVAPRQEDVLRFLLDLQDQHLRWAHGRTFEELCAIAAPENLAAFFRENPGPERPVPADLAAAEHAFYRQATLLLHFLLEGAGRRYRPGCLAFLKQVFAGHADGSSCVQSFQPATGPEIDDAFLSWALKAAAAGKDVVDPAVVKGALRRDAASPATADASAAAPAPPAPEPTAILTVPELALDPEQASDDERLALALFQLRRGRAQAGMQLLDELARTTSDERVRERAQRERRRAAAWVELREAFLRERLASNAEIELTYKGNKLKSRVLGYAEGKLTLEKERAPASLSPELIDPFELARQIRSGGAQDWARIYPYVLQQKKNAAELLREDGGESSALLADLRADYPERLRLADLLGRLEEFAEAEMPEKAADARARLDELAAWRRDADGLAVLEAKRLALRDHVRELVTIEHDGLEPKKLLHGKLSSRKDGTVLLAYEFDDPRELEDFSSQNYHSLVREALGPIRSPDVPFRVEQGQLVGSGQVWLRSFADFAAPFTVRYSVKFDVTRKEKPRFGWGLGVCADGPGHFVLAIDRQRLECYDLQEFTHTALPAEPLYADVVYAIALRHDGSQVTLLGDGEPLLSLAVGLQAGAIFLATSTDTTVRVERLEVEGRLFDALARLKRMRVEQELARF